MLTENKNFKWSDIDVGLQKILTAIFPNDAYLTSVKRSIERNEEVGGSPQSAHVDWDNDGDAEAVDVRRSSFSGSPEEKARQAYAQGATNVGIYNTHIHIDTKASRINKPYFKDNRTVFGKWDEVKSPIKSFDYFKSSYNKEMAIARAGRTQTNDVGEPSYSGYSGDTVMKIGLAVISIIALLGLGNDKK